MYEQDEVLPRSRDYHVGRLNLAGYLLDIASEVSGSVLWAALFEEMALHSQGVIKRIDEAEARQAERLNESMESLHAIMKGK